MTSETWPRVSIVINTLNRASSLPTTLESLHWLAYPGEFEVIVVNGPSTDGTAELLVRWADRIKVRSCPLANLSVSRNIGIAAASGEVVAFIDDDAVPEPEWLTELAVAYRDPRVGAAGGFVFDYTGRRYQATFATFNRLGDPVESHGLPATGLVYPRSFSFPHLIGTNTSFRRSALVDVGGFDEEYEYYLDDTDVLLRVMDEGWDVTQVAGAHIHHKFAPSNIRDLARIAKDRYSVVKNRTYFSSRHAAPYLDTEELHLNQVEFAAKHRAELADAAERGLVDDADVAAFDGYWERAIETGRRDAEFDGLHRVGDDWREVPPSDFLPFVTLIGAVERVVLVAGADADPRLEQRASRLAQEGLVPHVVRPTTDHSNIDFRGGVWWHNVRRPGLRWTSLAEEERDAILSRFPDARLLAG